MKPPSPLAGMLTTVMESWKSSPEFNVGSLDEIAVQEVITRPETLYELSAKDNTIAVVTDGTAVLGLERAGPRAAAPVMEGKPRCLSSRPALTRYPYA